jgi:hypothetical protein
MCAIAKECERKARDCPEQGEFVATVFIAKGPAVTSMAEVGSKEQVNSGGRTPR